jgi:hypothetical protein
MSRLFTVTILRLRYSRHYCHISPSTAKSRMNESQDNFNCSNGTIGLGWGGTMPGSNPEGLHVRVSLVKTAPHHPDPPRPGFWARREKTPLATPARRGRVFLGGCRIGICLLLAQPAEIGIKLPYAPKSCAWRRLCKPRPPGRCGAAIISRGRRAWRCACR